MSGSDASRLPPRLLNDVPLPPYSYVTGRFAHPTRDPAGHSFGHAPPAPAPIDRNRWHESRDYLWGCDLFNHGYYWEAHEAWEGLWHASGRNGATADFLKGLIKLAAAGVKVREGRPAGVSRHARRAIELFKRVRSQIEEPTYLGLEVARLTELAGQLQRQPPAHPEQNAPVEIVFDFQLLPGNQPREHAD